MDRYFFNLHKRYSLIEDSLIETINTVTRQCNSVQPTVAHIRFICTRVQ